MNPQSRIVVTRKLPEPIEARILRDYDAVLNDDDHLLSAEELLERAARADGILACHTDRFDADFIARLPPGIRVIGNISVGVDHVDLQAAKARGIVVTNTPDVLTDATAELTMLLILGAARRAGEGEQLVRSAQWSTWSPSFMLGTQVTGKRLGIVGMGGVGGVVARRARGFNMEIHYHNRAPLPAGQEAGARYHTTLEDLLPHCDFLSLHCPATPQTRHLLNTARIALLPDGAIVVNAARGSVVDEQALAVALREGKLAAAGLDVYENEPDINPEIRALPNTFLLPHIGSATRETRNAMGYRVLDNLDAVFSGQEPGDRVA
jgi:lactate dehydrogenase-like 2-hydroxyacid dehydrogenase